MKLLLATLLLAWGIQGQASVASDESTMRSEANDQSQMDESAPTDSALEALIPPPRGNVSCVATDNGYEEHRGGHNNCRQCLGAHDNCTETCSAVQVRCQAIGQTGRGQQVQFIGQGPDQWSAENQALRNCRYNARNCYVNGCDQNRQVVSRNSCRR